MFPLFRWVWNHDNEPVKPTYTSSDVVFQRATTIAYTRNHYSLIPHLH